MGVETTRYIRKPLYVDAVRVTAENFDEVAAWCDGRIEKGAPNPNTPDKKKKCIKVNVLSPKHIRQTMAFVGDWVLKQGDNFKIYTYKAFKTAFDLVEETELVSPHNAKEASEQDRRAEKKDDLPPQPHHVGGNIEIQDKRPKPIEEAEIKSFGPVAEEPNPETGVQPIESVEMREARETIETDGGTVEPATPEAITQAVKENEQARAATELAEEGIAEMVEEQQPTVDEIIESHPEGIHAGMSEAAGETPTPPTEDLDDVAKGDPIPEQPPQIAAAGKRVLSEHEQKILGPDEVRAMVRSGDVILAQDLAAAEQA